MGYIALGAAVQESDLTATFERQERIGYRSELIVGEAEVDAHMKGLFPDWRAQGVTVCLHEHQGGFAFNMDSVEGLHRKCREEGVSVVGGVEVTGFDEGADGSITAVETSAGRVEVGEQVVVAPGPWARQFWSMLGLPDTIDVHTPSGDVARDQPMWTYWNLQEGEVGVDPLLFATADGGAPPVIHLDTDAPLYTDDGDLVTDELWGIYFKRDRHSVQGGASPLVVDGEVQLDPYPQTTDIDPSFPDMFCAALSHSMSRFEGCRPLYKIARSGGVGAFTVDNFPVFDYFRPNLYAILDSNHGYKMIGVGREVAARPRRRALAAPLPVPLRALRDRRPAPGLELAVSLVLVARRSTARRRSPRAHLPRARLRAVAARARPRGRHVAHRRRAPRVATALPVVVLVALPRVPDELHRLPLPESVPCLPALARRNRITAARRRSRRRGATCATASGARPLLLGVVLLVALIASRSCANRDDDISQAEAVELAIENASFTPVRGGDLPAGALPAAQGVPPVGYWGVVLSEEIDADGQPTRVESFLVERGDRPGHEDDVDTSSLCSATDIVTARTPAGSDMATRQSGSYGLRIVDRGSG